MCARYEHNKDEAKIKLREKIYVFGAVPRANIRPTDLGPIVLPEDDDFICREMRWGWCHRAVENQPEVSDSKPATLR